MALSNEQRNEISDLLKQKIRQKLAKYNPETNNMPFHVRLLGKERMAIFSFVQSLNTTLGTSVFEQTAAIIARPHFKQSIHQYKEFNNTISKGAQDVIQEIVDDLKAGKRKPNLDTETSAVLAASQRGKTIKVKRPRIDLFIQAKDDTEYYFDLKTAKPNIDEIIGFKRKLLEWVAIRGILDPQVKVRTALAIPYNPYEPEPYARWTFAGMFDTTEELFVAEEFWNLLGGEKTYQNVLEVFEKVGIELRPEIDKRFNQFK